MTLMTPEDEVRNSQEILERLQRSIRDLRRDVEGLREQALSGEELNETAVCKELGKLPGLLRQCVVAENTLNECRKKQAGIAKGEHALDLEQIRIEIGCKLDKLRCTVNPD